MAVALRAARAHTWELPRVWAAWGRLVDFGRRVFAGRVHRETWLPRAALRRWRRRTRLWVQQRLLATAQTAEGVRCALFRWHAVAESHRIHSLATRVGTQRAYLRDCVAVMDRWRGWMALEQVLGTRRQYRQADVMMAMLRRWREATSRAARTRAAVYSLRHTYANRPSLMSGGPSPPSRRHRRSSRLPSRLPFSRVTSPLPMRATAAAQLTTSPPTAPPVSATSPVHSTTDAPLPPPYSIGCKGVGYSAAAPTHHESSGGVAPPPLYLPSHAAVARYLKYATCRPYLHHWVAHLQWHAFGLQLRAAGRGCRLGHALRVMRHIAGERQATDAACTRIAATRATAVQRDTLADWADAAAAGRWVRRILRKGAAIASRRAIEALTAAWALLATLANRRRSFRSIMRASALLFLHKRAGVAMRAWVLLAERRRRAARNHALSATMAPWISLSLTRSTSSSTGGGGGGGGGALHSGADVLFATPHASGRASSSACVLTHTSMQPSTLASSTATVPVPHSQASWPEATATGADVTAAVAEAADGDVPDAVNGAPSFCSSFACSPLAEPPSAAASAINTHGSRTKHGGVRGGGGGAALDVAPAIAGRRALATWREHAQVARKVRVAALAVRMRRQRREARHVFDAVAAVRGEAHVATFARRWCAQRAPLRRWRRLVRGRKYDSAAAAAARTHRSHLAWHTWRTRASQRLHDTHMVQAAREAAASHAFVLAWHTWRRRTQESVEREQAEVAAATRFVHFVQGVLSVCAAQVLRHWQNVAWRASKLEYMMRLARGRAHEARLIDAFATLRLHLRRRRRRALLQIEARMVLRSRRLMYGLATWQVGARASAPLRGAMLVAEARRYGGRVERLRAALRSWAYRASCVDSVVGKAMVARVQARNTLAGGLSRWHAAYTMVVACERASEGTVELSVRAARAHAVREWRHYVAIAAHVSAAAKAAHQLRPRLMLATWRHRAEWDVQRAAWFLSTRALVAVRVTQLRVAAAWGRWPKRHRVPPALLATVAALHAPNGTVRLHLRRWRFAVAQLLGGRDAATLGSFRLPLASAMALGAKRGRASCLRFAWRRWPRQPAVDVAAAGDDDEAVATAAAGLDSASGTAADGYALQRARRWGHAAAMTAALEHLVASLLQRWLEMAEARRAAFGKGVVALTHRFRVLLRVSWRRWRRETRRQRVAMLLGGAAVFVAAAQRRKIAWHCWQRRSVQARSMELLVTVQAAATAAVAVQACWRRWPRQRMAPARADALMSSHRRAYLMRDAWRRWPRLRVPPRMSSAVAAAHDRVAKLRHSVLTWQLALSSAEIAMTQRAVCSVRRLATAWTLLRIATDDQRALSRLYGLAAVRTMRVRWARGFEAWLGWCVGFEEQLRLRRLGRLVARVSARSVVDAEADEQLGPAAMVALAQAEAEVGGSGHRGGRGGARGRGGGGGLPCWLRSRCTGVV